MAKLNAPLVRSLTFIMLAAAAFGFIVSLHWPTHQPSVQTKGVKDSNLQTSSVLPSHSKIALTSGGREPRQHSLPGARLFPPSFEQRGIVLPPSLMPDTSTDKVTPPGQALKQPSVDRVSPKIPSGEQPVKTVWVPPQFQAKIVEKITPLKQEKVIALTFDDGPWPSNTPKVLDILKKNNIKATFFMVGEAIKDHPQLAKRVVAEGHVVANHTWHHWYHKLSPSAAAREIDDTTELIYKTTGVKTPLFRPPGAVMNNGVADYAKQKNYALIMWSNDPMDYRPLSAQELVKNVIRKAHPGAIVLMHDGGGNHPATVKALPQMIAELKELGYRFVTVPELLEISEPQKPEVIAKNKN